MWPARPDRLLRAKIRQRFLVTTLDEETFDGILLSADDLSVVLVDVQQVAPNGDRLDVDGELWLPRLAVKYLQRVNP